MARGKSALVATGCRASGPWVVAHEQQLLWLREECWYRGLIRLAELLDDLLTERKAEQPEPDLDPELEALLLF
jgi:hypothetical protein